MAAFRVWKWKIHWQIAVAMALGVVIGVVIQSTFDGTPTLGVEVSETGAVEAVDWLHAGGLREGDRILSVRSPKHLAEAGPGDLEPLLSTVGDGGRVEVDYARGSRRDTTTVTLITAREAPIAPFDFVAEIFRRLLQMLVVPLIFTSLVTGVCSLGHLGSLGRMGLKTIVYYTVTSLLAILVGLFFVNLIQPGNLGPDHPGFGFEEEVRGSDLSNEGGFAGILIRMVPTNVFEALAANGQILQVIFFSILLAAFITHTGGEPGALLRRFFEASFEVMMQLAQFVLRFIPIAVLALIVRVVAKTGLDEMRPLFLFVLTVLLALGTHALITLPALLWLLAKVRPLAWGKAVVPALMTAFSTSSSSITLPETLRSVQERGKVSNKTSSFVLPLGATINMDGTALYECVGVIFLAQYYAAQGDFELTLTAQLTVVVTALLASIGAAGIPSAGIVMMTTILSALGLPLEGVALLLAIDRPLDMLRTAVNIWSDTTCTAVVAVSEGETDIEGRIRRAPPPAPSPQPSTGPPDDAPGEGETP